MKHLMSRGGLLTLAFGGLMGVVFCAGIFIGNFSDFSASKNQETQKPARAKLTPEMVLNAETAASGLKVSLATGPVADGIEGLFALDHTTGDLYCWILNPRQIIPKQYVFHAEYYVNVHEALELDKGEQADLVLALGKINTSGMQNINNSKPAASACYVADGNTGRVGAFCFYFNRTLLAAKQLQQGQLVLVAKEVTRQNIERD